jgi:hypothetical protein
MLPSLGRAAFGAFAIAAFSTLGDFVWARWIREHRALFGLAHGLLLGAAIGLVLGVVRGRPGRGATGGVAIGLGAAGGYYALQPWLGASAMFVLWMVLWAAFGVLGGRWLGPRHSLPESLARGLLAALGSGLAFYAVSGIWTRFDPRTIDYPYHLACWTIAFGPGFLALLLERRSPPGDI